MTGDYAERYVAFFLGTVRKLDLWKGTSGLDQLTKYDWAIYKLVNRQKQYSWERIQWTQSKSSSGTENISVR